MRHLKAGRKFGRNTSHRRAMFRILAGNLVLHERIETTEAKAKELRRIAERLVTRAVRLGDNLSADVGKLKEDIRDDVMASRIHAQREVARFLPRRLAKTHPDGSIEEVDLVYKLFHEIAPRYVERAKDGKGGGYTRITKMIARRGDNAKMAVIEFIGSEHLVRKPRPEKAAPAESASDEEATGEEESSD